MAIESNGSTTRLGGITGRGFLPGQSGNPGGRPKGLAAAARAAVGDNGHDLIEFFAAIVRADRKFLGERRPISLRDRMDAARWLGDRGWGRAPVVVELPDNAAGPFTPEQTAALREMPEDLKQQIRQWLHERREAYLAARRDEAEALMRSYLPPQGPDGNGDSPL